MASRVLDKAGPDRDSDNDDDTDSSLAEKEIAKMKASVTFGDMTDDGA